MQNNNPKQTAQDKKIVDVNDFWLIPDNPMTKIGVFPYTGRQISPELEPDKIYQVLRPEEELTKPQTLDSLKLIPLINDHTMIGKEPGMKPAEDIGVEGVTGTNVKVNGKLITNDLKCYTENIKDLISSGKKDLSMGYRCRYELISGEFEGQHYDAIQRDICFNHIALVDEGRMGKDVRVMDSFTFDSINNLTQTKENNMSEQQEELLIDDEDYMEKVRQIIEISQKPDNEFEGGEEEKISAILNIISEIAPASLQDEAEEPAGIEPQEEEEEGEEEEGEEEAPLASMDCTVKYFAKRDELISRIRPIIGDNAKYSSMTIKQITKYACDKLDINNSYDTLDGYLKAESRRNNIKVSLDSGVSATPAMSSTLREYLK